MILYESDRSENKACHITESQSVLGYWVESSRPPKYSPFSSTSRRHKILSIISSFGLGKASFGFETASAIIVPLVLIFGTVENLLVLLTNYRARPAESCLATLSFIALGDIALVAFLSALDRLVHDEPEDRADMDQSRMVSSPIDCGSSVLEG